MAKKILLVLVLSVLAAGVVFSQTDEETDEQTYEQPDNSKEKAKNTVSDDFKRMAKNTITVDFGPTIIGGLISAAGDIAKNTLGGDTGLTTSGFGIAAQYERQLLKQLSVAGRFSWLQADLGYSDKFSGADVKMGANIISYSIEGHVRYYPLGETFFLDGMLGYANMTVTFSGQLKAEGGGSPVSVSYAPSQGFFALGGKIGWRISFGKNGGFTFEPSLGYVFGIGSGDTIWDQLSKQKKNETGADIGDVGIGDIFDILQNFIFVGGPRLSLAFGWRF